MNSQVEICDTYISTSVILTFREFSYLMVLLQATIPAGTLPLILLNCCHILKKNMTSKHEQALLAATPNLRTSKRASSLHCHPYSKNKQESNLHLLEATLELTGRRVSFIPLSPTTRATRGTCCIPLPP